jgi:hypothetical protein
MGNAQGRPAALTATTDRQAITKSDLTPIRLALTADLSVVRTGARPRTRVLSNISRLTGITTACLKYVKPYGLPQLVRRQLTIWEIVVNIRETLGVQPPRIT